MHRPIPTHMKKAQKALKILGFLCLVLLASIGVGISPAAPDLPKSRKKNNTTQVVIELVEQRTETKDAAQWKDDLA